MNKSKLMLGSALAMLCWLSGEAFAAPGAALPKSTAPLSEKQKIGGDVPIECWKNVTVAPWAVLLCIHGMTLHASNYAEFGKHMANLGVPTYAIDVRGFGSWQNTKDCARVDFNAAFADIRSALVAVRKANPNLPVILLGESMGGALALQAAADNRDIVDGLICSVPAKNRMGQRATAVKVGVGMVVSPNKELDAGRRVLERATQQHELTMQWEQDPLTRMDFSPKELLQFQNMMNQNYKKAEKLRDIPVLFIQGAHDRLVKPIGTVELFQKIRSADKSMIMTGESEHLVFEHGQFDDQVANIVEDWIDKRVVNRALAARSSRSPAEDATAGGDGNYNDPNNILRQALGHLRLAQGFLLLNEQAKARDELLNAIKVGHGSSVAAHANMLLLSLPDQLIAPPTGTPSKAALNLVSLQDAKENPKPSILIFCASWIKSCESLMSDVSSALGDDAGKINVVTIDADDPKNEDVLKEYGIKPLPAILYLDAKNNVVLYTLGNPGLPAMRSRIKTLLEG